VTHSPTTRVLFLCTGNAARSVIAGAALASARPELEVATAGTLTVGGLPISGRTRAALDSVGLAWPRHASRQAEPAMLDHADLVVALAAEHVGWVRREHPAALPRTATLRFLARSLPADDAPLAERVARLQLDEHRPAPDEDVADPGGGEVEQFVACAGEIVALVAQLAPRL
jgi:protein-tyrosine-phosphatase